MSRRVQYVDLPVGTEPNFEHQLAERKLPLKDISSSRLILQSLQQSRYRWLYHTFTRFSTRSKDGKNIDPNLPPHTLKLHGRCDLEIGPHTFLSTSFYELLYIKPLVTAAKPVLSTPVAHPTLTESLIVEATRNPQLSALLRHHLDDTATPEQKQILDTFIREFRRRQPDAAPPPAAPSPVPNVTIGEVQLVIEFYEEPEELWLFPRDVPVVFERHASNVNVPSDITLRTCVPFNSAFLLPGGEGKQQMATMNLRGVTLELWALLCRWNGGDSKVAESKQFLQSLARTSQKYLAHQQTDGPLLSQIEIMTDPLKSIMKHLKPTQSPPPRRPKRIVQRKQISHTPQHSPQKNSSNMQQPATSSNLTSMSVLSTASTPALPPPKKRKTTHRKRTTEEVPIVQCRTCGERGVPLIQAGCCRPCVEEGNVRMKTPIPSTIFGPFTSAPGPSQQHPQ